MSNGRQEFFGTGKYVGKRVSKIVKHNWYGVILHSTNEHVFKSVKQLGMYICTNTQCICHVYAWS